MNGERVLRAAVFLLLWGTAVLGDRVGARAGSLAALGALLVLPGWWVAARLRPGSPARVLFPLAYAATQGALALLALLCHLAGLPLAALLAPLFLLGAWSVLAPPAPGAEARKRTHTWALAAVAILLVASGHPRAGFFTDAPDHIGTVRFQTAEGDPLPGEYFHEGEKAPLDPRKGTNHTAFALVAALTRADPEAIYPAFWGFHVAAIVFAVFWLAESVLGGGGPAWTATILFLSLFRVGLADEWFGTAGYPGKAGVLIYFATIALALEQCRRRRRGRGLLLAALLGSGAAGVHAFSVLLSWIGLGALAAGLLLVRRLRPEGRSVALFLLANAAGAIPFLALRWAIAYPPSNPLHLHRAAVLFLPSGLAVIDPVTLAQVIGLAGFVSLPLLPFVARPSRGFGPGEIFLVASSLAVVLTLLNPVLFPRLDPGLGYLARRLPLLVPAGFVAAAVLLRGWERRFRLGAMLGALVAGAAVAITVGSPAARMAAARSLPAGASGAGSPWREPLAEAARRIPPGSTVLADPVTAYALYGAARLHPTAVLDQHSSPNDSRAPRRLADTQRFLRPGIGDSAADAILVDQKVDYLLINELFPRAFRSYNVFVRPSSLRERRAEIEARPGRFERLEAPEGLHLFRVVGRGAPGAADPPHRAVPAGGPPIGAEGPEGLRLLRGRCAEEELRPGEGCWIVTTWEATADAGPLPVQIYVRARRGGGRVPEQFAFRRDPAVRPWAGHPLGEPSFPSLLWREGEIVNDSHFVRVPLGCPPGRYEVQVVAETRPFFPVRRMRGLERGAVRDDWRPIDTLEVLP